MFNNDTLTTSKTGYITNSDLGYQHDVQCYKVRDGYVYVITVTVRNHKNEITLLSTSSVFVPGPIDNIKALHSDV